MTTLLLSKAGGNTPDNSIMVSELVAITSRKDLLECQANNFVTWGAPLSLDQYQHRDAINYESSYMDLTRKDPEDTNGGVYFVFRDSETKEIESACEILIRDAWIAKDGELIDSRSAVIGSVYTVAKHRGKGNAAIMMRELITQMKKKYLKGEYDSAFLYSEVGEYYSKFGYESFNVEVFQFDITKPLDLTIDYPFQKVYFDYNEIASDYYTKMKRLAIKKSQQDSGLQFMLKPTAEIFEWFANRARVNYWAVKHPEVATPPPGIEQERKTGVHVDDALETITGFTIRDKHGALNYVSFYPQFHCNDCYILAMHASDEQHAVKLLQLVLNQCMQWGMSKVNAWSTDLGDFDNTGRDGLSFGAVLQSSGLEYHIKTSNDSLSALQLLHHPQADIFGWAGNGKWCWF